MTMILGKEDFLEAYKALQEVREQKPSEEPTTHHDFVAELQLREAVEDAIASETRSMQ